MNRGSSRPLIDAASQTASVQQRLHLHLYSLPLLGLLRHGFLVAFIRFHSSPTQSEVCRFGRVVSVVFVFCQLIAAAAAGLGDLFYILFSVGWGGERTKGCFQVRTQNGVVDRGIRGSAMGLRTRRTSGRARAGRHESWGRGEATTAPLARRGQR